ncbi:HNH endonuclease [Saliphagus sp. GCM10025334]
MADELGCSKSTVLTWCEKLGVEYDQNRSKPWFDKNKLEELYHGEELSSSEIGDELGCSATTVREVMDRFGIDRRQPPNIAAEGAPWRDPELLQELYHDRHLSTPEIGERLGCTGKTVREWMVRLGIDRRDTTEARLRSLRRRPAQFHTKSDGYERWSNTFDGTHYVVYVHRLLAVSEFGFDAVSDMEVHHINGIEWDNRPENLELLSKSDHGRHHAEERWNS